VPLGTPLCEIDDGTAEARPCRTGPVEEGRRMAENDRTRGYRDNETYRRPRPPSPDPSGDPLAELARLIGQQNEATAPYSQGGAPYSIFPAADHGRATAPVSYAPTHGAGQGASHWASSQAGSYAGEPDTPPYGGDHYDPRFGAGPPPAGQGYSGYTQAYVDPRQTGHHYADGHDAHPRYDSPAYADPGSTDPRYADPRYADSRYGASGYENGSAKDYADPGYSHPGYSDPRYGNSADTDPHYADPRYTDPNLGAQAYGTQSYASADGYAQARAGQHYSDYGHQSAYGYQDGVGHGYGHAYGTPPLPGAMAHTADDHAPAKRRGSMVTVLAVLALAVVGTAAAFGYRAVFVGTAAPVPPPVIKADTQPSKVVPAADPNNKPIQDRIGVRTEKIVPRQEEPVQQAAPGQPRVIAPFLAGQNPQAFPPASANIAPGGGAAAPQSAASQPVSAEPKRIRTVPIKPQQGAEAPGPRSSRAAEPEANVAESNAPMALSPTGSLPATQRPAARQAHAAVTPNEAPASGSPFPTPLPASTGPAASRGTVAGPYAVQVTSQRSEADAQASYRSLQQQFPSVLGSRQPVIRRADLGERGTYYRAQIPFATQSEATEFCSSLKAAGGQCVVAKN
jgi:hypothetical protein